MPTSSDTDERRQYPRAPAATTAIVLARHNDAVALTIASISLGGARLEGSITVAMGERVQILFDVEGHPVDVTGEVVRVEMIDMAIDHIAVRFVDATVEAKELIRQLVELSFDAE
ncbi:MAG: PilZ domain-containing protein [Kofleriaceae bacterium]